MFFFKSLRAKTVATALIPTAVVLVAVAIIALYAYGQVSRDAERVVQGRDSELASITAARLSEALSQHSRVLQSTADDDDVESLEPARLSAALERAQSQLRAFDAGVVVYDSEGVAVWPPPLAAEPQGADFPLPSAFETVQRTLRPAFSNVFEDPISSEHVILVGVPILGTGNEFRGVLAGLSTLRFSPLGETYSEILELTAGHEGFAYLVDGEGRAIYHRDSSQIGKDLTGSEPVMRAIRKDTGALFTKDAAGRKVISGFAPVPGTDWGLITQERWDNVVGPIRDYNTLLLGLLVIGGAASGALIFFAIGRILKPVKDLTRGAQQIAGGDFDHIISAETGDEIQNLAEQFNTMASALKQSYAGLERKVAERTSELRQAEEKYRSIYEHAVEGIFQTTPDGRFLAANPVLADIYGYESPEEMMASVNDIQHELYVEPGLRAEFIRLMEEHGAVSGFQFQAYRKDGSVTWISENARAVRDEGGAVRYYEGYVQDITERRRAEEAVLQQTRELAVLEERNRMAREIHDTLAQGFTGIVLQLEAAEQALDDCPDEVPDHLSRAKNLGRESLQEARRSVWDLLPQALEGRALDDALEDEVHRFDAERQEKATFTVSGDKRRLPPDIQAALLRVCQESLANVRRHASATEVEVVLSFHPEFVSLTVQDNGVGFDVGGANADGGQSGFGLRGMEQRARLLRGTLTVGSQKDKGTLVEVTIPTA